MNEDKSAIEAVRQGDRERFAELVERHKRRVYAIAWSYLGNAEACEDAAQETFVRAYRYLGALRNDDIFPAWLSRITRNVSATFLRKHRSELEGLKRWQNEHPAPVITPASPPEEESLKEMLGRTLDELPPQHRECLVLFYLEGKSVRDTAAVLGVSEEAVKTRLHRARKALRGKLEEQVEQELSALSPSKNFVASVMLILPQKPLATLSIGGISLAGWMGNLVSSVFFALWMVLGQTTVFYLVLRWFARLETANLLDKPENDFRKTLLRRNVLTVTLASVCIFLYSVFATRIFGYSLFYQILALYCAWGAYQGLLLLRVNRSRFILGQTLAIFTFLLTSVLMGFFGAPPMIFFVALAMLNLVLAFTNREMPRRHDYNLFLRQAQGHLGEASSTAPLPHRATQSELRAFARFLGEQWLVRGYSVKGSTFLLRLPPLRMTFLNSFLMTTAGSSIIEIRDGRECRAHLGASDAQAIGKLLQEPVDEKHLTEAVSGVVQSALSLFLRGEADSARRLLSTVEDEAIFVTKFSRTRGYRAQVVFAIVVAFLMVFFALSTGGWRWGGPHGFSRWDGEPVSRAAASRTVGDWIRNYTPSARPDLLTLWHAPVHPSLALLGTQNVPGYKRLVAETLRTGIDNDTQGNVESRILNALLRPQLLYHALTSSLLSPQELEALGFAPTRVRQTLAALSDKTRSEVLQIHETSYQRIVHSRATRYRVLDIESFAMRLAVLKHFGCLDFVDRDALAKAIASHQVTAQFRPPEGFPCIDTAQARGLFHLGRCGLAETQGALLALNTLGRMDLIDHEACIEGILRFHRGKGRFKVDKPVESGAMIWGDEKDTFFALESLAMLNALGRVEDLRKWKFSPVTHVVTVNSRTTPGHITAASVLSWAYQERLERLRATARK